MRLRYRGINAGMAKRGSGSGLPSWLRHRTLLTTEAVLLAAVGQELLQRWVTGHTRVPWWIKTGEVMLVNAGLLGGLILLITALARSSLSGAHRAVQVIPLPAPLLIVHGVVFLVIFTVYAVVWDFLPPGLLGWVPGRAPG